MPHAQTTLKFENSADSPRPHLLPHTSLLYPFTQAARRKLNASGKMKTCPVTPGLPTLVPISAAEWNAHFGYVPHTRAYNKEISSGTTISSVQQEQEFQVCFHEKLTLPHFLLISNRAGD